MSKIFSVSRVASLATFWMLASTNWPCCSMVERAESILAASFCVCIKDFFSIEYCSARRSRSCLMVCICVVRWFISFWLRCSSAVSCSLRSCSPLVAACTPRMSLSIANSVSSSSCRAFWMFCSASSRRCMPTRLLFHCWNSCCFSNSMLSISRAASLRVARAASVSRFCAASCASWRPFISASDLICSFILSMRKSCFILSFSIFWIASSALYVARRVTCISAFICSLKFSTCCSVMLSWLTSSCAFCSRLICVVTSPFLDSYLPLKPCRCASDASLPWLAAASTSCRCSSSTCSLASCCCTAYRVVPSS
mmetsp:Transcript_34062/g.84226  ORF Transcript_34062/g.84226 Transcript_34062/m.84226 type:complete len:311 (+) Transcript_34062:1974-2906(+)